MSNPKDHPVDSLAQTLCDAGATMSAAYRQVAINMCEIMENSNKAAQDWMKRAIEAEEEIREGGRGIDLRKGFER